MRKGLKILCLAASLFFLLAGGASATLTGDFMFKSPDGTQDWANLNVVVEGVSGDWTYTFTLSVLDDEDAYQFIVHELDIPVISEGAVPPGYTDLTPAGGIPYFWASEFEQDGTLYLGVLYDGIEAGKSAAVRFKSPYDPALGEAVIVNTGGSSTVKSTSALGALGGGGSSVPEPTALLLVGIGILGIGTYRHLSRKGR